MDERRHDFHELRLASSVYHVGHLQGTIGPAEALGWTSGTISWQDGLFVHGSGGYLVGEWEAPVLDGTDAVAEVELGAGSSGLVGLRSCVLPSCNCGFDISVVLRTSVPSLIVRNANTRKL